MLPDCGFFNSLIKRWPLSQHHFRTIKHYSDILKYPFNVVGPKIWKDIRVCIQQFISIYCNFEG